MKIVLNDAEQRLAIYLAKARYQANRNKGVVDAKIGDQGNWETDLEGVAAEIAFCKHHNVYPDLQTESHEYADCYSPTIGSVDVKSTRYKSGRLIATRKKNELKHPDIYVLMIGEFPEYYFAGYASADELLRDENLIDLGYGETYGLEQERLKQ